MVNRNPMPDCFFAAGRLGSKKAFTEMVEILPSIATKNTFVVGVSLGQCELDRDIVYQPVAFLEIG